MPASSRSPPSKKSPFVTQESWAFATFTEVCGGMKKHEWLDDSEEDLIHPLKTEIPPFDGRKVEKYAKKLKDTWCSLARPKARIG